MNDAGANDAHQPPAAENAPPRAEHAPHGAGGFEAVAPPAAAQEPDAGEPHVDFSRAANFGQPDASQPAADASPPASGAPPETEAGPETAAPQATVETPAARAELAAPAQQPDAVPHGMTEPLPHDTAPPLAASPSEGAESSAVAEAMTAAPAEPPGATGASADAPPSSPSASDAQPAAAQTVEPPQSATEAAEAPQSSAETWQPPAEPVAAEAPAIEAPATGAPVVTATSIEAMSPAAGATGQAPQALAEAGPSAPSDTTLDGATEPAPQATIEPAPTAAPGPQAAAEPADAGALPAQQPPPKPKREPTPEEIAKAEQRKQRAQQAWERVVNARETNETLQGTVTAAVKGGLLVDVGGVRGFLPASQVRGEKGAAIEGLVKTKLPLRVIDIDQSRRRIVVSHRRAVEEERRNQRRELLASLQIGQVREGTVVRIAEFGAFVDLGGVDGLIPMRELAFERVDKASDVVSIGEKLPVEVIRIEENGKKIGLSRKNALPDPWRDHADLLKQGATVQGRVIAKEPRLQIELAPGVVGNLREGDANPDDYELGESVEVVLRSLDRRTRRINLSLPHNIAAANAPQQPAPAFTGNATGSGFAPLGIELSTRGSRTSRR